MPRVCCSIVPPHVLRNVAVNATKKKVREAAANSLDLTAGAKQLRMARGAERARRVAREGRPDWSKAPSVITVDAKGDEVTSNNVVARRDAEPADFDLAVNEAHEAALTVIRFLRDKLGRNSLDDCGFDMNSVVHFGHKFQNAMWTGAEMVYGDGDGDLFNRFTGSLVVCVHEFAHGLTEHTCDLVYRGQPGALNEHLSDAWGCAVEQYVLGTGAVEADWLVGRELLGPSVSGKALRDMLHPGTAYDDRVLGRDPQPDHLSGFVRTTRDGGGVHINSGIPNRAFAIAAMDAGGFAADTVLPVWYEAMRDPRVGHDSSFSRFANATIDIAKGKGDKLHGAVRQGWDVVGVVPW